MKISGSDLIPPGRYALVRDGKVAKVGPISELSDHYQPGDILCVNTQAFEDIKAVTALTPTT